MVQGEGAVRSAVREFWLCWRGGVVLRALLWCPDYICACVELRVARWRCACGASSCVERVCPVCVRAVRAAA